MSQPTAELELTGALSGANLGLTNPETGEVVVLNVSLAVEDEVKAVFFENDDE
jgi:hypothetical protein